MVSKFVLWLIHIYQDCIAILLPKSCRFLPTCSEYAKQAILKYGLFKGGMKAVARIARCHPFSDKSGYDPLV